MDVVEKKGHWVWVATPEEVAHEHRFGNVTPNGIVFRDELAGPAGSDFFLMPSEEHTKEDIKKAKRWLRNQRDVVSFYHVEPTPKEDYPG